MAKATGSLLDDKIFSGQLSLTLYLFPAVFAGLGVNLLTHVLVNHLNEAETEFDKERRTSGGRSSATLMHWSRSNGVSGDTSEVVVLMGSAVGVVVIFMLDLVTGTDIRLHVLYIFPLAMIARHCGRLRMAMAALSITTILQVITFSHEVVAVPAFITDIAVAFAASLMIVYLARTARSKHLVIANQAAADPLTGLANRRAFTAELESEITRQRRYGGVFSLAVMDLDGFKALNDSKGHASGDEALKLVADILRNCTRASDSVGRLGGDEFAVLLPNTQDVDCGLMLHELCRTIAEQMGTTGFAVTASIGCKAFRTPPDNPSQALQLADKVMYDAKAGGKNRVVNL
jgi:diguanylate cyclase (GGDEF)-like protein